MGLRLVATGVHSAVRRIDNAEVRSLFGVEQMHIGRTRILIRLSFSCEHRIGEAGQYLAFLYCQSQKVESCK